MNGQYRVVKSPYKFDYNEEIVQAHTKPWPGNFNGTGTIIEFECSETFFNTIQQGIKGKAGFHKSIDYLREELGYIYSGVIEKGKAVISLIAQDYNRTLEAVKPTWVGFYKPEPGDIQYDLGGGKLKIEYIFGEMDESKYSKYYKRNMSTSGVEIRINGRLLASNIFKKIWGIEEHPSYNHFLAIINLVSNNRDALPKTRTSKNGIRIGDEKLEKLFNWIISTHPNPHKEFTEAVSEKELVKELASLKEKTIRNKTKNIETEFKVFKNINSPVSVDLYVYDGQEIVLYEAKKEQADVQNLYQLLMYWDGAVADGITPTEGILLASNFSVGVDIIINIINSLVDQNGNNYNLVKKTWDEEGVAYPKK